MLVEIKEEKTTIPRHLKILKHTFKTYTDVYDEPAVETSLLLLLLLHLIPQLLHLHHFVLLRLIPLLFVHLLGHLLLHLLLVFLLLVFLVLLIHLLLVVLHFLCSRRFCSKAQFGLVRTQGIGGFVLWRLKSHEHKQEKTKLSLGAWYSRGSLRSDVRTLVSCWNLPPSAGLLLMSVFRLKGSLALPLPHCLSKSASIAGDL